MCIWKPYSRVQMQDNIENIERYIQSQPKTHAETQKGMFNANYNCINFFRLYIICSTSYSQQLASGENSALIIHDSWNCIWLACNMYHVPWATTNLTLANSMISFVRPSNSAAPWAKWLIGYSCRGNLSEFYVCKGKVVNLALIATGLVRGWMSVHPRPCWRRLANCEINVCNNTNYMYTVYKLHVHKLHVHNGKRYKTSLASSALFLHCHCVVALCTFFFKG